jgi:hypothetical protein
MVRHGDHGGHGSGIYHLRACCRPRAAASRPPQQIRGVRQEPRRPESLRNPRRAEEVGHRGRVRFDGHRAVIAQAMRVHLPATVCLHDDQGRRQGQSVRRANASRTARRCPQALSLRWSTASRASVDARASQPQRKPLDALRRLAVHETWQPLCSAQGTHERLPVRQDFRSRPRAGPRAVPLQQTAHRPVRGRHGRCLASELTASEGVLQRHDVESCMLPGGPWRRSPAWPPLVPLASASGPVTS